jgi:hypothetical protein
MWRKEAFRFSGVQKAIIGIAGFLCVWRFLQVPAVGEAILNFFAGGEVPFSHATLSPAGMIWAAAGIATAVILLILRKELVRFVHFVMRKHSVQQPIPQAEPTVFEDPKSLSQWPIIVTRARTARAAERLRLLLRFLAIGWLAAMVIVAKLVAATIHAIVRGWHSIEPHIRRFDHWLEMQVHALFTRKPLAMWVGAIREVVSVLSIRKTS